MTARCPAGGHDTRPGTPWLATRLRIVAGSICFGSRSASARAARVCGIRRISRKGATGSIIGHGAAGSTIGAVLVTGAALLFVTACQHQCRAENQDRFFHGSSFVNIVSLSTVSVSDVN